MLSSKNLNQNMFKMHYFSEKNRQALRVPPSDYRNLTHTNCTATKRSNFVAHKKSILTSKISGDFSAPSLCDVALHFTWLATALIESIAEGERIDVLGMQDFAFAQSDSVLPNKIC